MAVESGVPSVRQGHAHAMPEPSAKGKRQRALRVGAHVPQPVQTGLVWVTDLLTVRPKFSVFAKNSITKVLWCCDPPCPLEPAEPPSN